MVQVSAGGQRLYSLNLFLPFFLPEDCVRLERGVVGLSVQGEVAARRVEGLEAGRSLDFHGLPPAHGKRVAEAEVDPLPCRRPYLLGGFVGERRLKLAADPYSIVVEPAVLDFFGSHPLDPLLYRLAGDSPALQGLRPHVAQMKPICRRLEGCRVRDERIGAQAESAAGGSLPFAVLFDEGVYLLDGGLSSGSVVVLLDDQFLEFGPEFLLDDLAVFEVDDGVVLAVDEEGRDFALPHPFQVYFERVVVEFGAVLLRHFQRESDGELGSLHVFIGDFEGDHLEGVEGRVDDLQADVAGPVLEAVEEGGGGAHRPPPQHELGEPFLAQVAEDAVSTLAMKYECPRSPCCRR